MLWYQPTKSSTEPSVRPNRIGRSKKKPASNNGTMTHRIIGPPVLVPGKTISHSMAASKPMSTSGMPKSSTMVRPAASLETLGDFLGTLAVLVAGITACGITAHHWPFDPSGAHHHRPQQPGHRQGQAEFHDAPRKDDRRQDAVEQAAHGAANRHHQVKLGQMLGRRAILGHLAVTHQARCRECQKHDNNDVDDAAHTGDGHEQHQQGQQRRLDIQHRIVGLVQPVDRRGMKTRMKDSR